MIEEIPTFPIIPRKLRDAASLKKLVPFIGAGVSAIAGYPDWDKLADEALRFFVTKQKLDHAQLSQVMKLPARVKLSLAIEMEKKYGLQIEFDRILKPSRENREKGDNIYRHILKLYQYSTTVVTTNYDEELDKPQPSADIDGEEVSASENMAVPRPVYNLHELTIKAMDIPNAVIHIHGSVQDRNSMLLTTTDYLNRYYGHQFHGGKFEENPYLTFMKYLFANRNVLFIGYGLSELEILEYILQKGLHQSQSLQQADIEEPRHYLIQGFFTHELELARSLERYFLSFGIGLLPFSRNEQDWNGLIDVIGKFAEELPRGSRLLSSERIEMEGLLQ
jgi:hypothetical protein